MYGPRFRGSGAKTAPRVRRTQGHEGRKGWPQVNQKVAPRPFQNIRSLASGKPIRLNRFRVIKTLAAGWGVMERLKALT